MAKIGPASVTKTFSKDCSDFDLDRTHTHTHTNTHTHKNILVNCWAHCFHSEDAHVCLQTPNVVHIAVGPVMHHTVDDKIIFQY